MGVVHPLTTRALWLRYLSPHNLATTLVIIRKLLSRDTCQHDYCCHEMSPRHELRKQVIRQCNHGNIFIFTV